LLVEVLVVQMALTQTLPLSVVAVLVVYVAQHLNL
jgi:hypothetical protein